MESSPILFASGVNARLVTASMCPATVCLQVGVLISGSNDHSLMGAFGSADPVAIVLRSPSPPQETAQMLSLCASTVGLVVNCKAMSILGRKALQCD